MTQTCWKDEYSVGDPIIDAQHRQLIDTMNQLSEAIKNDHPSIEDASRIFSALAVYVMDHFSYEEQRMAAASLPADELNAHYAIHTHLTRQIRDFQTRVNQGDLSALRDLMPFLQGTWLTNHICDTDQQYVPYLSKK